MNESLFIKYVAKFFPKLQMLIEKINGDNFNSDLTGYSIFMKEYLNLAGFDVDGYDEEEADKVTLEDLIALEY